MSSTYVSTLQKVVDDLLGEHHLTALSVLLPDRLESGKSFDEITDEIVDKTGVPVSSRTVRRWAKPYLKRNGGEAA